MIYTLRYFYDVDHYKNDFIYLKKSAQKFFN